MELMDQKKFFFESYLFLVSLVCGELNQPGDKIKITPHALSDKNTPSNFLIQFEKDNIRYAYGMSVTKERVENEFLYHFKSGRKAKIFDRVREEYTFGKSYKSELENVYLSKRKIEHF